MVTLLANPLILRSALLFLVAGAFLFAVIAVRRLRRTLLDEASLDLGGSAVAGAKDLPVHLYSTVIQQLKQQKHELQQQTLSEQRRARASENFSQTVLSNLPCGVLVFGPNGLVKQANPAAKEILGFESITGMNAQDVFRQAEVGVQPTSAVDPEGFDEWSARVSDEINSVLRENGEGRQLQTSYTNPAGRKLDLALTLSPIPSADGNLLGVACLIADRSEFELFRREQQLRSEVSAGMALQLRTSLTAIANYAHQLAGKQEPNVAQQLNADIAREAASLDQSIGGFLTEKRAATRSSAQAATGAT